MNYFEFYNIPLAFNLDTEALRQLFLKFSKQYHPDFHTLESDEKQAEILELSTINNEAYKTLKDRDKRIKYILELKNLIGDQVKTDLPPDFLMEMMDVNERLMDLQFDYDAEAHEAIKAEIEGKEQELLQNIQPVLENYKDGSSPFSDLEAVRDFYLQNRYLLRLKENLQKLV